MPDQHLQRTADDYAEVFAGALPTGPAWPRDPDSIPMQVVGGLMQTWGRVDARFDALLRVESDPRYTLEMLPDWERAFGLPDPCVGLTPQTIPDRRAALVNKIASTGGQSRAFFIDAAASLGYPISIYEFQPVVCGISRCGETRPDGHLTRSYARCGVSRCGVDPICKITMSGGKEWIWRIGAPELRYVWKVKLLENRVTWFRCGTGRAGQDHLAEISHAVDLECMVRRWKPTHTTVLFDYTGTTAAIANGSLDLSFPGNAAAFLVLF